MLAKAVIERTHMLSHAHKGLWRSDPGNDPVLTRTEPLSPTMVVGLLNPSHDPAESTV